MKTRYLNYTAQCTRHRDSAPEEKSRKQKAHIVPVYFVFKHEASPVRPVLGAHVHPKLGRVPHEQPMSRKALV